MQIVTKCKVLSMSKKINKVERLYKLNWVIYAWNSRPDNWSRINSNKYIDLE
jgi:hypothetical protein